MITYITNAFTNYSATIITAGTPSVSTILRHTRKSKAKGCLSVTEIIINGQLMELANLGNGPVIVAR